MYFAYGVGLTIFVLEPQVMAWLGPRSFGLGRLAGITAIEVGFTLALLPFILSLGVAELTLRRFWLFVEARAEANAGRPAGGVRPAGWSPSIAATCPCISAVSGILSLAMLVAVELAIRSGFSRS